MGCAPSSPGDPGHPASAHATLIAGLDGTLSGGQPALRFNDQRRGKVGFFACVK